MSFEDSPESASPALGGSLWGRLQSKRALLSEMARFGSVGIFSNLLYFVLLGAIDWTGLVSISVAGAISYAICMVVNYALQRRVTFRSQREHRVAATRYVIVYGAALLINAGLLEILVVRLGMAFWIGQGIALVATTIWNYVAQKLWVFFVPKTEAEQQEPTV